MIQAAEEGRTIHSDACNRSTTFVTERVGVADADQLQSKLLDQQIDFMNNLWQTVSATDAQELTNNVEFSVVGLTNPIGSGQHCF